MKPDPTPYPGPLKVGATGPAVSAVQLGLEAWGDHRQKAHPDELLIRDGGSTGIFGRATGLQCGHVQHVRGLKVTNSFGPGVHAALEPWYPPRARDLLVQVDHDQKLAAFYRNVLRNTRGAAGTRRDFSAHPSWFYTMTGDRMDLDTRPDIATAEHVTGDCSSTGGIIVKRSAVDAGLDAPGWANLNFYTGNMIDYGRTIARKDATVGDRVHYGSKNTHVGVVMGIVQGLLCVYSFGGEPGPLPRWIDYREIYAIKRDYE